MEIIIQSLGFTASAALELFIQEKLQALKSDRVISANVILYKGADGNPDNNYCEIKLEIPGNDPFVKKHSAYFEVSVSECVDVLVADLQKAKSKQVGARKGKRDVIQDALMQAEDEADSGDVELEDVVR